MARSILGRSLFAERLSAGERLGPFSSELESSRTRIAELERERDVLRQSHARLREELELLKRRLFVAKAERVDTTQLELEFADKLRELEKVAGTLGMGKEPATEDEPSSPKKPKRKPTGRRDLRSLPLEERRFEISDPLLEQLVAEGKAVRHGFEESVSLMRERGGMRRVVTARVKYVSAARAPFSRLGLGDRTLGS